MPEPRFRLFCVTYGWLVAIAVAYLYVFPYFPRIRSANELPRAYLVKAIVEDGTFAIDREVRRWGPTYDLAEHDREHPERTPCTVPRVHGQLYQNKAPGASLLAVPFYAIATWVSGEPSLGTTVWLCRVVTGILPSLGLLWLLWGFLARFAPDPAVRRLVLVAYAFGSMAMTYSLLFYGHQLSAVCIASAWILAIEAADRRRGVGAFVVAGLLAGMAPLVDYEAAFAGIPLTVHVLWKLRAWPRRELIRTIAIIAVAAAVPVAVLLGYHAVCFGSPLRTGYSYSTDCEHTTGFLGMTRPAWKALVGITVAPDNGFITLAPWWLLAIPGGIALWRRGDRATVVTAIAIAAVFVYFVSSIGFWRAGWEIGPRYLTAMQPFLLPLVATTLTAWRDRPVAIGAASGAILIGVIIYTLSVATLPYWPDSLHDPLYEVTFRLLRDGAVSPSVARVFGIRGLIGIAPFVLGIGALVGWSIARVARPRGLVMGLAIAVAALLAFALVPHGGAEAERAYVQTLYPAVAQ